MIQATYISSAAQPMTTEQLLALLQQCLANNAGDGVTGILLYGNGTFLQALEGEADVVDRLYEKIQRDPRHTNVTLLTRRTIERRQYAEWSMGFKRVSDHELQQIEGLRDFSARDFNAGYLTQHAAVVEGLMDHYRTPYWDPLVRELDEQGKTISTLKNRLAHARGCVEIAALVLESIAAASRSGSLGEDHVRLCDLALDRLRQV